METAASSQSALVFALSIEELNVSLTDVVCQEQTLQDSVVSWGRQFSQMTRASALTCGSVLDRS